MRSELQFISQHSSTVNPVTRGALKTTTTTTTTNHRQVATQHYCNKQLSLMNILHTSHSTIRKLKCCYLNTLSASISFSDNLHTVRGRRVSHSSPGKPRQQTIQRAGKQILDRAPQYSQMSGTKIVCPGEGAA